jgi:hypothetical protein
MALTQFLGPTPYGGQGAGAPLTGGQGAAMLEYLRQMFGQDISPADVVRLGGGDGNPVPVTDDSQAAALKAAAAAQAQGQAQAPAQSGFGGRVRPAPNQPAPPIAPPLAPPLDTSLTMPSILPQARGVANPPPAAPAQPGPGMPMRPAGVSPSGLPLQPGSLSPGALAAFNHPNPLPWRGPLAGDSPANIAAAGGGAVAPAAAAPAGGAAQAAAPPIDPRFTVLAQGQNIDPLNRRGSPQMTALNLAGLFNRAPGQAPASAVAPAAPANAPVKGPLARPDLAQRTPLSQTPMPPVRPPFLRGKGGYSNWPY